MVKIFQEACNSPHATKENRQVWSKTAEILSGLTYNQCWKFMVGWASFSAVQRAS